MANYLVTDTELTSIADAIRTKGGTSADLEFPSGFVTAIGDISGGGSTLGTKTITANDTYDASDDDLDGYSQVTVNVPTGTARTSADLSASGATVTAPAGLYAEAATKSVASGSATTPATTITANPSISVDSSTGVITASASATQSVTPTVSAGYVSSGTAGTITVSGSNTSNLTTQAAQTIHPSTSDQTIAAEKYLTGAQTVKGVLLTNLTAGNIKKDVVVKVGDSTDDDCVTSVTGTYEGGGGGDYVANDWLDYTKPTGAIVSSAALGGTGATALAYHTGITSVHLTAASSVPANFLQNATSLVSFVGRALTGFPTSMFLNCSNLTAVDILGGGNIGTDPFRFTGLVTLILRGSTLCTLTNVNSFRGTKFVSGGAGGTIYIPETLYNHLGDGGSLDYKAATTWSTIDGYGTITWAKIEGSYYATHYADGTAISS